MSAANSLNVFIAFGGGLASFFSPCILPLIPAYLGSLGTLSNPGRASRGGRLRSVGPSLAFIAGFSAIFVLLGLSLGVIGSFLVQHRLLLSRFGGAIVVLFGISQLGVLKLPFLQRSWSPGLKPSPSRGAGKLFFMGVVFSLGWSPCIGSILAGILFLALGAGNYQQAVLYLIAYSAGLALPFLAMSFFVETLVARLGSAFGFMPWLGRISGVLLILLGAFLISGKF